MSRYEEVAAMVFDEKVLLKVNPSFKESLKSIATSAGKAVLKKKTVPKKKNGSFKAEGRLKKKIV